MGSVETGPWRYSRTVKACLSSGREKESPGGFLGADVTWFRV